MQVLDTLRDQFLTELGAQVDGQLVVVLRMLKGRLIADRDRRAAACRESLETRPARADVIFTGAKFGKELASYLAAADVFVFPSKTDTFGLVLLEAMACGVPIAAYPVTGPADIVEEGITGYLDEDLTIAAEKALNLSGDKCIEYAKNHSWLACTKVFSDFMFNNRHNKKLKDTDITNQSFWCL